MTRASADCVITAATCARITCHAHADSQQRVDDHRDDGTARAGFARCSSPMCISARKGCQADRLLDFLRYHDADTDLSGRRHRRRLAAQVGLVLAAGPQRRGAEAPAQGAQGRAHRLRARQSRRVPARLLRHPFRRHRGGRARHPRGRRRPALSRHPRRLFRPRRDAGALARAARRQGLRLRDRRQPRVQHAAPAARLSLLVAVAMGEAQGEERGQLYRRIRAHAGRGGAAATAPTA